MANLQQPGSGLVECVSCHELCNNRKYLKCRRRVTTVDQNLFYKIALSAKYREQDILPNVNQQDGSPAALDVPFEDRRYCYDCFKILEHLFEDLMHEYDGHVLRRTSVFKGHPQTSDHCTQQQGEDPAWFNDFWHKTFKSLDYFFGTDTCKSMQSPGQCNPRTMFESLAMQKNDLPVRLGSLAEFFFSCASCNVRVGSKQGIEDHKRDFHQEPSQPVESGVTTDAPGEEQSPFWHCSFCDELYETQETIDQHNAKEHDHCVRFNLDCAREAYTCLVCNRTFNEQHELDNHIDNNHQQLQDPTAPEDASEPPFSCARCNRTFNSRNAIENHNRDTHEAPPAPATVPAMVQTSAVTAFTCTVCKAMFRTRIATEHHCVDLHDGLTAMTAVTAYCCDDCGKMFETKRAAMCHNMDAHAPPDPLEAAVFKAAMREALSIANLTCFPCDKVFGSPKALSNHKIDSHDPKTCHCNKKFPGMNSFKQHQKVCLPDQTVTPNEIKQEPVYDPTAELNAKASSEGLDGTESNLGEDSEDGPEDGPEDGSEDDWEGQSEDDSEFDPEEDSEAESADESEVEMEQHVEEDNEDDEGPKWPEHGQKGRIPCIFRHARCNQVFSAASMMIQHNELHFCPTDVQWFDSDIFDDSKAWSRKVYDGINCTYKCPNCKSKGGGRFEYLFQLVDHAESNQCNLKVRTGPIREIRSKLLEFADQWS
ncbi:hypothetical protein FPOA_00233 [Fusarium poae]|uniref:C2H2-type domain-containing protein n=1 Tax=Fusarium poae TaxID=36050 RepID=A0A1B8B0P0_FUSPO|nr:hypothetical protein FPOA_00233 [Fusarium poae]